MSNTVKILRNSAYSLIAYALISALTHFVYAAIDYSRGILSINVVRHLKASKVNVNGFDFTNSEIGVIQIKPSFIESVILENQMFNDGGSSVVFYLTLGGAILLAINFKLINIYKLEEQNVYQLLLIVVFLFFAISLTGMALMDNYVGNLTNGAFKHDHTHGFSNLYPMGLIVIASVTYQFVVYTRKLKQENDLTI
ncbi:hypothetical protein EZ456_14690 [Pedobacter psychrodurus]|uniref:DUF2975 domain-containing protein n=1 Tax=Pedobacter psychrodurus TaxID=2530456 RepID=A0A4R0PZI2_9SPHI|nr:hypothetical protein [Pedobacter psychrodurus]TCD26256.1 hypothetical protein EZ456_14690 [Pedobacter psychrodurus]